MNEAYDFCKIALGESKFDGNFSEYKILDNQIIARTFELKWKQTNLLSCKNINTKKLISLKCKLDNISKTMKRQMNGDLEEWNLKGRRIDVKLKNIIKTKMIVPADCVETRIMEKRVWVVVTRARCLCIFISYFKLSPYLSPLFIQGCTKHATAKQTQHRNNELYNLNERSIDK